MRWRATAGVILAALAVGLGILAVAMASDQPAYAPGGQHIGYALLGTIAGWSITLAGLLVWRAARGGIIGCLLALAGPAWLIAASAPPATSSAIVFTAALLLTHAAPALIAHAALAWPDGRLGSRVRRASAAIAYLTCIGVAGVAATVLYDPGAEGCLDCPANLVAIPADIESHLTLTRWGLASGAVALIAAGAALTVGLVRSPAARRLRDAPLLIPAIVFLGLRAADLWHGVARGFVSNDATDRRLWVSQALALAFLAAATAWEPLRKRRTRTLLARLVAEHQYAPGPGGLRDVLATALGDPGLRLLYTTDAGAWIDPAGRPVEAPDERATQVLAGHRVVGALIHRPGALDDPALYEELISAAQLAFENERLHATAREQLSDLRASRARVVAAADLERRRLERDLHDGAQQRLVGLTLSLRLARRAERGSEDDLRWAEDEVRTAVGELRELAHGIYPAALGEEGLAAALETLAEADPRLRLLELCEERLPEPIESAAYVTVARILHASGPERVDVRVRRQSTALRVSVQTQHAAVDIQELTDRAGALDGTLAIDDNGTLVALLPLRDTPGFSLPELKGRPPGRATT